MSIHAPLTAETRNLIGDHNVSTMLASSILVNTARGGIVDEDAVAGALGSGHLDGAALNVFSDESLPEATGSRCGVTSNQIATPHTAGISIEPGARVGETTAGSVRVILDGAPPS